MNPLSTSSEEIEMIRQQILALESPRSDSKSSRGDQKCSRASGRISLSRPTEKPSRSLKSHSVRKHSKSANSQKASSQSSKTEKELEEQLYLAICQDEYRKNVQENGKYLRPRELTFETKETKKRLFRRARNPRKPRTLWKDKTGKYSYIPKSELYQAACNRKPQGFWKEIYEAVRESRPVEPGTFYMEYMERFRWESALFPPELREYMSRIGHPKIFLPDINGSRSESRHPLSFEETREAEPEGFASPLPASASKKKGRAKASPQKSTRDTALFHWDATDKSASKIFTLSSRDKKESSESKANQTEESKIERLKQSIERRQRRVKRLQRSIARRRRRIQNYNIKIDELTQKRREWKKTNRKNLGALKRAFRRKPKTEQADPPIPESKQIKLDILQVKYKAWNESEEKKTEELRLIAAKGKVKQAKRLLREEKQRIVEEKARREAERVRELRRKEERRIAKEKARREAERAKELKRKEERRIAREKARREAERARELKRKEERRIAEEKARREAEKAREIKRKEERRIAKEKAQREAERAKESPRETSPVKSIQLNAEPSPRPEPPKDESKFYPEWLGNYAVSNSHPMAIRLKAASNSNIPPRVLSQIALSSSFPEQLRLAAVNNPRCPPQTLALLVNRHNSGFRIAAAKNPNCPWQAYALQPDSSVKNAGAQNPNCSPNLLTAFARESSTRTSAVGNQACPQAVLNALATHNDESVKVAIASNPNCSPYWLDIFIRAHSRRIREAAASNPSCPAASLDIAVRDRDTNVKIAALMNPSCERYTAEAKVKSADHQTVRAAACLNPNCGADVIKAYANERTLAYKNRAGYPVYLMRMCALRNLNCHPATLNTAAFDNNILVRAAAVSNPNCPVDCIKVKALQDSDWQVRYCAIRNPSCPDALRKDVLFNFANDERLRAAAAQTLGESPEKLLEDYKAQDLYYIPDSHWMLV